LRGDIIPITHNSPGGGETILGRAGSEAEPLHQVLSEEPNQAPEGRHPLRQGV